MANTELCTYCGYPLHSAKCTECGSTRHPQDPLNFDGSTRARKSWSLTIRWAPLVVAPVWLVASLLLLLSLSIAAASFIAVIGLLLGAAYLRFIVIPLAYRFPFQPPDREAG